MFKVEDVEKFMPDSEFVIFGPTHEMTFSPCCALSTNHEILYVPDRNNSCIFEIEIKTGKVKVFAGIYKQGGHHDGERLLSKFNGPTKCLLSPDNKSLMVVDQYRIRCIDFKSHKVSTISCPGRITNLVIGPGSKNVLFICNMQIMCIDLEINKMHNFGPYFTKEENPTHFIITPDEKNLIIFMSSAFQFHFLGVKSWNLATQSWTKLKNNTDCRLTSFLITLMQSGKIICLDDKDEFYEFKYGNLSTIYGAVSNRFGIKKNKQTGIYGLSRNNPIFSFNYWPNPDTWF
jgi:hypothetical protein